MGEVTGIEDHLPHAFFEAIQGGKEIMEIILNGRKQTVGQSDLSYDEIAKFAGHPLETSPTVTYRHAGPDGRDEGILAPGENVIVTAETVINCMDTGNA